MEKDPLFTKDRNKFIETNKSFIYNIASYVCKRKLDWLNDDELSIAMIAFNRACDTFRSNKGNFYSFAKMLIKNSLIDFFRKSEHTYTLAFATEDESIDYIENKGSLTEYEKTQDSLTKAEEIALFSTELSKYKLTFEDLVKCSPVHIDTRNNLLSIAFQCSKQQDIVNKIKSKKLLPVKEIILLTGTKKKLIEKWRKYILVLIIVISSNEYPYIKSYFNIKAGEHHE